MLKLAFVPAVDVVYTFIKYVVAAANPPSEKLA